MTPREPIPPQGRVRCVLGIDPSLTATGIAVLNNGELKLSEVLRSPSASSAPEWAPRFTMPARLIAQRNALQYWYITTLPHLIAMEAEIWTSNPAQSSQAAAIQATYQTMIYEQDPQPRFLSVNVSHVKKWIGAQKKQEILLAVYKRYSREFKDDNAADAFVIAMIGDAFLKYERGGEGADTWTKPQREVLETLKASGLVWEGPPRSKVKKRKPEAV
jgi:Holliday junction resolvasome RuvABC endonuclease subunit